MTLTRPGRQAEQQPGIAERAHLVALGRYEVHEPMGAETLFLVAGADRHLAVEDDDERVLVDLMVRQALAGGEREQDDPVGVVVGAQDARRMRRHGLGIEVPYLHGRQHTPRGAGGRICKAVAMALGTYGVWTSYRQIGEENAGAAAALAESLGFGTFWLGGSPRLPAVQPLLEGAEQLTVATGIVNIWAYEPADLAAEYAQLAPEYGDRLLVGIGVGHPEATSDYRHPLRAMRAFLDGLDAAAQPLPAEARCLAALRPKMLELAGERSRGAHTYFVGVEHTRAARERLGPDALLATELACVLETDPGSARETARGYARMYLGLSNYTSNLLGFGFTQQDIADGGSDRLIDAIVPHGSAEQIAAVVREHLDAGADHVCLQPVGVSGMPRAEWSALADALAL